MRAVSPVRVRTTRWELSPLDDLEPGRTYEDDWKMEHSSELKNRFDGKFEFERSDGEWRVMEVEKCGSKKDPLSIDPDVNQWTGKRRMTVIRTHPAELQPAMSPVAAQGLADDWAAAQEVAIPEEVVEMRRLRTSWGPTAKQRMEHEEENHAVYREWCGVCRVARSTGTQHKLAFAFAVSK